MSACRSGLPFLLASIIAVGFAASSAAWTDELDPGVIDQHVRRRWATDEIEPAPRCSDRTFVRRVYLDLAGRIPTTDEVDEFLGDQRENRRELLIDSLLGGEDHVIHLADLFDTLLMGRGAESAYDRRAKFGWRSYLENAFRQNRPWDEVVKEVLLARPSSPDLAGSVWFLYERNNQHQAIAESIAPAFFGIRIECAQCHDHMMADEIKQAHYWGLVAFFNRSKNEDGASGPRLAESAIGGFSEFADLLGESIPNRLTFLDRSVEESRPEKGVKQEDSDDLYASHPEGEPRVPKFSRRERFVGEIVDGNPLIARAMVNRLWAILMSRGIVHPYDEMDSMHEASHPELLDWLAKDFVESGYDVRRILRGIARSEAYHLESVRPDSADDPATFAWYLERPLTAEQLGRSIQLAARGTYRNDHPVSRKMRQQFREVLPDTNTVTVSDALFLSNQPDLETFIRESVSSDHLVGRIRDAADNRARADIYFQTLMGRPVNVAEAKQVADYIHSRPQDIDSALTQVLWALLNSAEFRFNH